MLLPTDDEVTSLAQLGCLGGFVCLGLSSVLMYVMHQYEVFTVIERLPGSWALVLGLTLNGAALGLLACSLPLLGMLSSRKPRKE